MKLINNLWLWFTGKCPRNMYFLCVTYSFKYYELKIQNKCFPCSSLTMVVDVNEILRVKRNVR